MGALLIDKPCRWAFFCKKRKTKRKAAENVERYIVEKRKDSRQILNGILWIARSGAGWRDLPERYGAWQTIDMRFVQWQEVSIWALCI